MSNRDTSFQDGTINAIKELLTQFKSFTKSDLMNEKLGDYKWTEIEHIILDLQEMVVKLAEADYSIMPFAFNQTLLMDLKSLESIYAELKTYRLSQNFDRDRAAIINRVREQYNLLILHLAAYVSLHQSLKNDAISVADKLREIDDLRNDVDEKSKDAIRKINTVIGTIEGKAKELGISKYSEIFSKESQSHQTASKIWLAATVVLLISILWYVICLASGLDDIKPERFQENNYIILLITSRVLIFSVLFFATSMSIRNYKSHKHNEVVNRHRHNALTTFEAFSTAASSDPQTKNAVLLEATRSIFASQNTGYGGPDSETDSPSKVIEVFKTVVPKSGTPTS